MRSFAPFSEKQLSVIAGDLPRITILSGAVRSGKTFAANVRFTKNLRTLPPGDLLISGKTKHTIKRNVLNDLFDLWGKANYSYNSADGVIHAFGRRIWVVGANDEKAENKIRGMSISGYYGDEETLKPKSFFEMVQTRMDVKGAQAIVTTNPDNPYHWLKVEYMDDQRKIDRGLIKVFNFTLEDNLYLDPEVKQALRESFSGVFKKRMIDGLWVIAEGLIFDMFTDDHITRMKLEEFGPEFYVVSADYGTRNPTAFLLSAVKFVEDVPHYYIFKEYYYDSQAKDDVGQTRGQKTDSQYYQDLVRLTEGTPISTVILDPSAASFEAEINHHGQFHVEHANNEILEGIRLVSDALKEGRVHIHEGCQNLIREMRTYSWDEKKAERGIDHPSTVNDHAVDAARYLVAKFEGGYMPSVSTFDIPIEDWDIDDY